MKKNVFIKNHLFCILGCALVVCFCLINPSLADIKANEIFKAVQLHDLDQAKRLIGFVYGNINTNDCNKTGTAIIVNGRPNQDVLTCGDKKFEFDDLSDSNNKQGGTVYESLQGYFCENNTSDKQNVNSECMKKVVKVWGGTTNESLEKELKTNAQKIFDAYTAIKTKLADEQKAEEKPAKATESEKSEEVAE